MNKTVLLFVVSCAMVVPALNAGKEEEEVTYTSLSLFKEEKEEQVYANVDLGLKRDQEELRRDQRKLREDQEKLQKDQKALRQAQGVKRGKRLKRALTLRRFSKLPPKSKSDELDEQSGINGTITRERRSYTYGGQGFSEDHAPFVGANDILPDYSSSQNFGTSQELWDKLLEFNQLKQEMANKETPLGELVAMGKKRRMLLEDLSYYKEHVNSPDTKGRTPLVFAIDQVRYERLIKTLLRLGANPNLSSKKLWSPLHFAVSNVMPEIVEKLLKKGADPCVKNSDGKTPLELVNGIDCSNCEDDLREIYSLLHNQTCLVSLDFLG